VRGEHDVNYVSSTAATNGDGDGDRHPARE
jgi:hypothetical protein